MSHSTGSRLSATPLTAEAFAPFGQVIERNRRRSYAVNEGSSSSVSTIWPSSKPIRTDGWR